MADNAPAVIQIAVSSCLLGQPVRYDGGHKYDGYITESIGRYVQLLPFCPEVAIGLGVPRPPIQLVNLVDGIHARGVIEKEQDVTAALQTYAHEVANQIDEVSGYIFKKGSPSCGLAQVPVYTDVGEPSGSASGVFAQVILSRYPFLPVEDEAHLQDPVLRENFIERVFVYSRWQLLLRDGISTAGLIDFHARHKFILLAHSEPAYREMGRLVGESGTADILDTAHRYLSLLMPTLRQPTTRGSHTNVLQHIMGFFTEQIQAKEKQELLEILGQYRQGLVPLSIPLARLQEMLLRYPNAYLMQQYYLYPEPHAVALRSLE